MSTRGAIALPEHNGWRGRYHHFDSYPSGLGAELFRLYHQTFDRDHREMAAVLIDEHPAGWSSIIAPADAEGPFTRTDFAQCGFTETGSPLTGRYPECYCHGGRDDGEAGVRCRCPGDSSGCSPVWIEWAYVLDHRGMAVATSWHPDPHRKCPPHRPIALIPWQAREPDWDAIVRHARHPLSYGART